VGAVDYVFKPVEPMILRSKVSVFIELHKRAQEIRRQAEIEKRLLADNMLMRLEQQRTEAALERSLTQQELVLQSLPLALYASTKDDGFATRHLIGGKLECLMIDGEREPTELEDWIDNVHPADLPRLLHSLRELENTGTFSAEYRWRCADGQYRWLSDRGVAAGGERFGILLDISERRSMEEQLVHAQKMEAIGQMTGGIAHDFNNMLSVIISSLDRALATTQDDPRLHRRLDLAMQAASSCADLTKRLLTFARRQALDPKAMDLRRDLPRVEHIASRLLPDTIRLQLICADDLWQAYLDPAQLEAAIINLIINARDAMPNGGVVTVKAVNRPAESGGDERLALETGDYVEVSVADSGEGMSSEVQARAFDPFFTTKEIGKGTGLGLSSVYGFIRQSGGGVVIDSAVGQGTTVRLFLPRASHVERADAAPAPTRTERDFDGVRVLVVEDEDRVRAAACEILEELGCEVRSARDGEEALAMYGEDPRISLLFTDCMMPGQMDGPGLALELRRRDERLPILFTSGVLPRVSEFAGSATAIFLPKPYTAAQLTSAVATLTSGPIGGR
jgi:signal transduction histidine kinase